MQQLLNTVPIFEVSKLVRQTNLIFKYQDCF